MSTVYELIDELIQLGDDRDELEFWKSIYPNISADEQRALVSNLEKELKELKATMPKDEDA